MSNNKALVTLPQEAVELTVSQLKGQVTKIQEVMRSVMKDGVHFGSIPGIPQKFLFKAGAEKLCMTFRLIPHYNVSKTEHKGGHITYDITCTLTHQPSSTVVGEGVGSGSTLERKYRYRNEDFPTGVEVPKAWWQTRDKDNLPLILKNNNVSPKTQAAMNKERLELTTGKINGKFQIVYRKRVENKDIADVYNTVVKMAKKRALVDATITALAVSDMFSQDIEAVTGEDEEAIAEKKPPEAKNRRTPGGTKSNARTHAKKN
jgi:hypothetical protein